MRIGSTHTFSHCNIKSNVAEPFYIAFSSNASTIRETANSTSNQAKSATASSSIVSNCSSFHKTPTTLITLTYKSTGSSFSTVMSASSVLTSQVANSTTNASFTVSRHSSSQNATGSKPSGTITNTSYNSYPSTTFISTVSPGYNTVTSTVSGYNSSRNNTGIKSSGAMATNTLSNKLSSGSVVNPSTAVNSTVSLDNSIMPNGASPTSLTLTSVISTKIASTRLSPVSPVAFTTPRSEQILILDVSLTFKNKEFQEELYDKNSSPFLEMKKEVENKIEIAYQGTDNFIYAIITGFRPGSVICDGRLYFKNASKSDIRSSKETLEKYGSSGGGFTISKFDINAGGDDNDDGDDEIILGLDWWQIGVIIAGIVAFILIITVIVLCVSIYSTGHLTNELHIY